MMCSGPSRRVKATCSAGVMSRSRNTRMPWRNHAASIVAQRRARRSRKSGATPITSAAKSPCSGRNSRGIVRPLTGLPVSYPRHLAMVSRSIRGVIQDELCPARRCCRLDPRLRRLGQGAARLRSVHRGAARPACAAHRVVGRSDVSEHQYRGQNPALPGAVSRRFDHLALERCRYGARSRYGTPTCRSAACSTPASPATAPSTCCGGSTTATLDGPAPKARDRADRHQRSRAWAPARARGARAFARY